MTAPTPNTATGLEIAARLVKVVVWSGTALIWLAYAVGIYSLYQLWSLDHASEWFRSNLDHALFVAWLCIGFIVVVRVVQIVIGWAVLVPIEATIQGINLRDPEVAGTLRTSTKVNFLLEAITLAILVSVPLLIAHFRHGYFS